jgi:hypothetical protein
MVYLLHMILLLPLLRIILRILLILVIAVDGKDHHLTTISYEYDNIIQQENNLT